MQAWNKWGTELQLTMVIEECSELIQSITKHKRGITDKANMIEEVADVEIMLAFMREYLGDHKIDDAVDRKLERLELLVGNEKGGL